MRILNLMLGKHLGGIEQAALDYALALTRHHPDTAVLTVLRPGARMAARFSQHGLDAAFLPHLSWWDPMGGWRLRQLCRKFKPDIVLCHGNRALKLAAWALSGKPVVAVAHNYQLKHAKKAYAAFGVSKDLTARLMAEGVRPDRCFHIPNLVTLPEEREGRHGRFRTPPVIGAMGRFVAKKGFDAYLHALALLKEKGVPFTALLGGGGEEDEALRALCAELGLEGRVTFTGWVQDKRDFFDRIDVFCLPSHHEPFGIVLLEAMSEGLPVVSTMSEGPREIGADGIDMRLVPVNDPAAMAKALADFLAEPSRAQALGAVARKRAQEYAYPAGAARIAAALEEICRQWRRRAA